MPRYRFTAVDSYGTTHDGTIDAASEAAARNKLASNGLAVRTVEEVAAPPGTEAPEVPRRAAPKSAGDSSAAIPRRARAFDSPEDPPARRGSPWPLVLSLLALFVSLATAVYTFTRNRDPLSKYDFRTPEGAVNSEFKIMSTGDFMAQVQYQQRVFASEVRDRSDVTIRNTVSSGDKRIVFYEYDQKGRHRKECAVMERDDHGMWRRSVTGHQDLEPRVIQEMQRWQSGAAEKADW